MAEEAKVEDTSSSSDTSESKESEKHIDLQAQLEEERTRRIKAEEIIQRHKEKPKTDEESFTPSVDPDEIRTVIREGFEDVKSSLRSEFRADKITEAIQKIASDSHHAALIRWNYENSIRQSGDLELDVENALALANKKRVQSDLDEARATFVSRDTKSSGSGAGRKVESEREETLPNLSDLDRKNIEWLREKYVLNNDSIQRILKGERIDDLLEAGIVKKR